MLESLLRKLIKKRYGINIRDMIINRKNGNLDVVVTVESKIEYININIVIEKPNADNTANK